MYKMSTICYILCNMYFIICNIYVVICIMPYKCYILLYNDSEVITLTSLAIIVKLYWYIYD